MEVLAIGAMVRLTAFLAGTGSLLLSEFGDVVFLLRSFLRILRRFAAVRSVKIPEAYFARDPHLHLLNALDDLNLRLLGIEGDQIPPTGL
jgi:hypothetical protein